MVGERVRDAVSRLCQTCRAEANASPDGFLSLRSRRQMLLTLGPPAPSLVALEEPPSQGHRIRAKVSLLVAERALPLWTRHHAGDPGDVPPLMDLARAAVDGAGDRVQLLDEAITLYNHLGDGGPASRHGIDYIHSARAIARGAMTIARDEQLLVPRPELGISRADVEDPEDPDMFDCAFWAAAAEAGDLPWGSDFDYSREAAVAYWEWYLAEAVPTAVATVLA